jgi:HlyD family secretion protein
MLSPLLRRLLIALLVLLLMASGIWWANRPKPVAVVLKEIERGLVESTIANTRAGTIEACQRTRLSTITGGRIEILAVKEGDHVSKGQLLMKLWNDDQQAQSALALAQVATTRHRGCQGRQRTHRSTRPARRLRGCPRRLGTSRNQGQPDARRAGANGTLCAICRYHRQDSRRGRRVLDAIAARRADTTGD